MKHFQYQGVDEFGKAVTGSVEAADRRSAVAALVARGHYATSLLAQKTSKSDAQAQTQTAPMAAVRSLSFARGRASSKDVLAIINQLGAALQAGLPLLNCLQIIRQQQNKPAVKDLLSDLIQSLSSGDSLSEAMGKHPRVFTPLSQAMIRVGETGGILEQTADQLGRLLRRDEQVKSNLKTASAYPLFVLSIGMVSVVVIVTWILPTIVESIAGGVASLPVITQILLAFGAFVKSFYGLLGLIIVIAALVGLKQWIDTPVGRLRWDAFKLRIPVSGRVLVAIAVGRFARTLGALTKGGVTILESLSVVRDTLANAVLAREIDHVIEKVRTGEPMAASLEHSGYFPPLLVQITAVGEQTGKLDELLLNAAETLDREADAAMDRFMAVLPAVLILLLALVVGFIVAATLLPIVGMELNPAVM